MPSKLPTLFVSGFLPSAKVPSGGQRLAHVALLEKAAVGPVVLLAFCNELEREFLDRREFGFCAQTRIFEIGRGSRLLAAMLHPGLPLAVSARHRMASRWLREQAGGIGFSEVWVEFVQAASVLECFPAGTQSTLVVHDLLHQAMERRAQAQGGWRGRWLEFEATRTRRWEARMFRLPDRILALNDKDRGLVRECSGRGDVGVRYPMVAECYRKVRRDRASIEPHTMLFWGQMSRVENEDAVCWFVSSILPSIRRGMPGARFLIAGASPTPRVRALAGEGVEVLGYVQDPVSLFERVEMAVVPLRLGSGIKIKVVEFMAARIPTVATPVGAEGVRSEGLLAVAADADAFAQACLERLGVPP